MAIENVQELRTVNGVDYAQKLLDQGWQILAVCVMQDGTSQYAEYHMGRPKTVVDENNPLRQQFIAAGAFGEKKSE
ncbi:hypothetical protein [Pseudomonas sp. FSL R10-2398]|uniref:hypothetical protein n=1 Tax=Pseudomonas sp. FSL R10-2398 TaxID=2662201 RepID=UPI0012950729|nr:hypothetical protein [Pseudomonas sp. FSL R10-2398]MQT55391.1 hypothetical protein [Pseudomonas sp. FSL R10-2398]